MEPQRSQVTAQDHSARSRVKVQAQACLLLPPGLLPLFPSGSCLGLVCNPTLSSVIVGCLHPARAPWRGICMAHSIVRPRRKVHLLFPPHRNSPFTRKLAQGQAFCQVLYLNSLNQGLP